MLEFTPAEILILRMLHLAQNNLYVKLLPTLCLTKTGRQEMGGISVSGVWPQRAKQSWNPGRATLSKLLTFSEAWGLQV